MKYPISEPLDSSVWLADQWIELHASPREIWPWLAQMGNGRAGWYSYDWIDNLGKKSLTVIDPQLVVLHKGQKIPLAEISDFVEDKFITFKFGSKATFTYYLEPFENKTRLWTRLRVTAPSWLVKYTLGPAHKIMQNKQFLEIKKRVEHNL